MKKRFIVSSIFTILILSLTAVSQSFTAVSATLQDTTSQVWSNAQITAALRSAPNFPGVPLNNGHAITDTPQFVVADGSGTFNLTLDDNKTITPAGSQWTITVCPNASVQVCTSVNITITGASQSLTSVLNSAIMAPVVNAGPVFNRAYNDSEVLTGNGGAYWRTSDNSVRGCQAAPNGVCTWINLGGSGTSTSSGYGLDATKFAGADPCVQLQAAIYSLTSIGGIVNASGFSSWGVCSVNPFSQPVSAGNTNNNPVLFTGLPTSGLLILPDINIPEDVPWYFANKWSVQGAGGYGTSRTTIQPSNNFKANRTVISAVGTGGSGCSSAGAQTVTITGTTISNINSLPGMFIQCGNINSATAIPNVQTSQVDGIITAVSGTGPYTLTLGGAGAAGVITNSGFTINPVISGWEPISAAFGSKISQLAFTCSTPSTGNVTGCYDFMDTTGEESSSLVDVGIINYDTVGLGIFTAQAQNGGTFGPLTFNSTTTGNNNTIAIELGGTGWNAGGGGGGLCSPTNACSGPGIRGFHGVTISASGTGNNDGGIGIDVNAGFVQLSDIHLEFLNTGILLGNSAPVQNVNIDNATGCSNSNCALTSIVDISATYQNGSSPGPTQNINLRNISRQFSTTWDVRDFMNLLGSNDNTLGIYSTGANGGSNRTIFTNAQQMSCINTGGNIDVDGSHCAPNNVIQIVSKLNGVIYADAFNVNNSVIDMCQQINNALKWAASNLSLTTGAIFDATGFNRVNAYPCATNPFSGVLGTTIPGSGILKLGQSRILNSVQWMVPVNWILQGAGGSGIGGTGATGTVIGPNTGQTVNASYSNDSTTGTISSTLNSYTITGGGGGGGFSQTFSNLDDSSTGWGNCNLCGGGGGVWSSPVMNFVNASPSLDGNSMKVGFTGGTRPVGDTTNGLWYNKVGINNTVTYFTGTYHFYVQTSITNVQALEFDQFQFNAGTRYMMGSECDNPALTGGFWRIWNQLTTSWVSTSTPCTLFTANTWHTVIWLTHRVPGDTSCSGHPCMYYDTLTVDGTPHILNLTEPSGPSGDPDNNGMQFQIDMSSVGGTVTAFLDTTSLNLAIPGTGTIFSTENIGHYLLACATLPCTNQAAMVGGIITGVPSSSSLTLDVPAQATLANANYTITPPLIRNSGIIRDVGLDGNAYGTGGGNFNGGLIGLYQTGGSGSFVENLSFGHFNAGNIDSSGLLNGTLRRIQVAGNGIAASIWSCVTSPQGINIDDLICQSGTSPTPSLSNGIFTGGNGFTILKTFFQNVKTGIEVSLNAGFTTNNVTIMDAASGSGSTGTTTLIDLGGITGGSTNGPAFTSNLMGLNCPSGCTNIVNDHLTNNVLNDSVLNTYILTRTNTTGNHYILSDALGIPFSIYNIPYALSEGVGTVVGSTTINAGTCATLLAITVTYPGTFTIGSVSWGWSGVPNAAYNLLIPQVQVGSTIVSWIFCNPTAGNITLPAPSTQINYQILAK